MNIKEDNQPLASKGYLPAVAQKHFEEGEYSRAVDVCLRHIENEPASLSAHLIMARSLFFAGDYERSQNEFLKTLRLDSNNLTALKFLGDISFEEGHEAAAISYYRKVFELAPNCRGLYCRINKVEKSQTHRLTVKRKKEHLTKGGDSILDPAFVTETIGDIYREQGYYKLAREVYRRLITDEDNSRISNKLSSVEKKLSNKGHLDEISH
ncbi:MAG: tetratricopeptide repeat protein [candidate division Zixibacteria bacterium]